MRRYKCQAFDGRGVGRMNVCFLLSLREDRVCTGIKSMGYAEMMGLRIICGVTWEEQYIMC